MSMSDSLAKLSEAYTNFSDRWNNFRLEAKSGSQSPSHVFIENWTAENAATIDKNPTWLKNLLIAMPATLAIAAPIVAGPAGLLVTAAYAATLAPIIISSKNKEKKLDRDSNLLREIVPEMQRDFVSVIEQTRTIARQLHEEHLSKGSSSDQLRTEMEELKLTFEQFFSKQFEVDLKVLRDKAPIEPHGHFDYTGANMAASLIDEIDRLSEIPDNPIVSDPIAADFTRGASKAVDRGPEIPPPTPGLGR